MAAGDAIAESQAPAAGGQGGAADPVVAGANGKPRPKQAAAAAKGKAAPKADAAAAKGKAAPKADAAKADKVAAKGKAAPKAASKDTAADNGNTDADAVDVLVEEAMEEMDEMYEAVGGDLDCEEKAASWTNRLKRFVVGKMVANAPKAGGSKSKKGSVTGRFEDVMRYWELGFSIRTMTYVGKGDFIDTFLAISLVPSENPTNNRRVVRLLTEYSPAVGLTKNEAKVFDNPHAIYRNKMFRMPYKDLEKHIISIAMWKISKFTFNTYVGHGNRSLAKIVKNEANIQFAIKEKFTRKAEEKRKKERKLSVPDVAMLGLTINAEEMFDFQLHFENWSLELKKLIAESRQTQRKCLIFVVPKNSRSNPSRGRNCYSQKTQWKTDQDKLQWGTLAQKEPFIFRGTRTGLSNSYVICKVFSGDVILSPLEPPTSFQMVGAALMNMTSILDISVFTGRVKDLQTTKAKFNVGAVNGSIKAVMCSMHMKEPEEIPSGRPQQPRGPAGVGHLNPGDQKHLVVRVMKCDNLAVADLDVGTSDPYIRVCWDNMVQKSHVVQETCRPVFNTNFYFPVRYFNHKVYQKKYFKSALLFELESKGDINIQVWDDDDTSAEALGFVKLSLSKILRSRHIVTRTLRGPSASENDAEDEDAGPPPAKQWFDKEREVRVFDGTKSELKGCMLSNPNAALIFYEVYFYPDWHEDLQLDEAEAKGANDELWTTLEKDFNIDGNRFAKEYAEIFPDGIGAKPCWMEFGKAANIRRFPSIASHPQTLEKIPLMAFMANIITPEEYTRPGMLMHWLNCITHTASRRQSRTGEIPSDGWKDPQTFLFTRKGSVQEHALLLCSVLKGAKKDAFVCKGTIWIREEEDGVQKPPRLVEHTWVLTREKEDWITFWEPTTRDLFHLPNRWKSRASKKKKKPTKSDDDDLEVPNEDGGEDFPANIANEIPDSLLQLEDLESLPTIGRMPRPKIRAAPKKVLAREALMEDIMRMRTKSPMAPREELTKEGCVDLVDWLPYDSIDVIFNDKNLWANRQNHHPACIHYDFDAEPPQAPRAQAKDPNAKPGRRPWQPLISDEEIEKMEKENQDCKYDFKFVVAEVRIDPALTFEMVAEREASMVAEMEENMRLARGKRGMDTYFEKGQTLVEQVNKILFIVEEMRKLDIDLCPWLTGDTQKPFAEWTAGEKYLMKLRCHSDDFNDIAAQSVNKLGNSFCHNSRYDQYIVDVKNQWETLAVSAEACAGQDFFDGAVLRGKTLTGYPIHFCTSDTEEVRAYLMSLKEYQNIMENKVEGTVFTIHCKMFALLGGVQSLWLWVGTHEPQKDE